MNDAILHAIFGDGCAVAVVGGRTVRSAEPGSLAVLDNRSWLVSLTLLWCVCLLFARGYFFTRTGVACGAFPVIDRSNGWAPPQAGNLRPFCCELVFGGTTVLAR